MTADPCLLRVTAAAVRQTAPLGQVAQHNPLGDLLGHLGDILLRDGLGQILVRCHRLQIPRGFVQDHLFLDDLSGYIRLRLSCSGGIFVFSLHLGYLTSIGFKVVHSFLDIPANRPGLWIGRNSHEGNLDQAHFQNEACEFLDLGDPLFLGLEDLSPDRELIQNTLFDLLPEIRDGDKRVLLVNGEPMPYALARVPAEGDARGNLAAGATGVGVELSERMVWIAGEIGPVVKEKGLMFVGLDVIGDHVTEINVTSPTCIRELDGFYGLDIAGQLMDAIETKLQASGR